MLGKKGNNEELSSKFELKYIRSQNHPYCEHCRSIVPNGPGGLYKNLWDSRKSIIPNYSTAKYIEIINIHTAQTEKTSSKIDQGQGNMDKIPMPRFTLTSVH